VDGAFIDVPTFLDMVIDPLAQTVQVSARSACCHGLVRRAWMIDWEMF